MLHNEKDCILSADYDGRRTSVRKCRVTVFDRGAARQNRRKKLDCRPGVQITQDCYCGYCVMAGSNATVGSVECEPLRKWEVRSENRFPEVSD